VIEEILQEEIIDETDQFIDVVKRIQVAKFKRSISTSSTTTACKMLFRSQSAVSINI